MSGSGSTSSGPWKASDMPSMEGKIAIVTGSNSGIGFTTALELVRKGAHVVLACRNQQRATDAIDRIQTQIQQVDNQASSSGSSTSSVASRMTFLPLDLSDLKSVRAFAKAFQSKFDKLHLLVNNAGGLNLQFEATVSNGMEKTFVTNHLGHFLLTCLLMDVLQKTSSSKGADGPSRVVHVSSVLHSTAKVNTWEEVAHEPPASKRFDGNQQYAISKLCNLLFCFELDRRLREAKKDQKVISIACHPGCTYTELIESTKQTTSSWFFRFAYDLIKWFPVFQTAEMGALPTLFAAASESAVGGAYYGPNGFYNLWGPPTLNEVSASARDQELANKLWKFSEKMAECTFDIK